jgi:D-alanyl-D-alanine carboxypeptidase/D-alanyl-D-alanine-endopeptidase (penicillin-binding protein 4)
LRIAEAVKRVSLIILIALLLAGQGCSPQTDAQSEKTGAGYGAEASEAAAEPAALSPLQCLDAYKEALASRGHNLSHQGVLIESVDGKQRLADHNSDYTFNPASVMKLATSLVALSKFGPDHRYRTNFLADGHVDAAARKLEGDLVVEGGTDPMFSNEDAQEVAAELSRIGISHVTGALRIVGPFYYYARGYHRNLSRETSANKLRTTLVRAGLKIDGQPVFGEKSGALLVSHYSNELVRILLYQNAFSSNAVADVIGESVGGPQVIQDFLIEEFDLKDSEVYVGHASGLDFNRLTPRASIKVLRALFNLMQEYSLEPETVLPVAGIDSGTLRARLHGEEIRGSVLAKTGTLVSFDEGVSTLVGVAYTKEHGPLLFAIFNSVGNVNGYRKLQDEFVQKVIAEKGGPVRVQRVEDALAEGAMRGSITQVLYKSQAQPSPAEDAAD